MKMLNRWSAKLLRLSPQKLVEVYREQYERLTGVKNVELVYNRGWYTLFQNSCRKRDIVDAIIYLGNQDSDYPILKAAQRGRGVRDRWRQR